jgi:hypothetical protein
MLSAQDSSGFSLSPNLLVTVSDPSGAFISSAEVRFEGEKELTARTTTNGSVQFSLPYGNYVVWVKAQNFTTTKIVRFAMDVNTPHDLHVVLQPAREVVFCCGPAPLIEPLRSYLPDVIEPPIARLWSWFGDCGKETNVGLEVLLDGKVIEHLSFPICPILNGSEESYANRKTVAFSFKGGHIFKGEYRTRRTETIEGNIWQAGTDPGVILLGISFMTKKQVVLNTIHAAKLGGDSTSEIDRGLSVRTFPIADPR